MAYPSTGPAARSDTLPQSLCHDAYLGLDRSGGIQADVFPVTRANKLHAYGVTGHETDRDDNSWEAKDVDRRHEPQVVPEQRMDARIAAEIRSYMSKLEKGATYPGLEIIVKLATVLEVEPAELLRVPAAPKS